MNTTTKSTPLPTSREVLAFVIDHFRYATPRSVAYREGFAALLTWRLSGAPTGLGSGVPPYRVGTSDADAWWSGWDNANRAKDGLCDACRQWVDARRKEASNCAVQYYADNAK